MSAFLTVAFPLAFLVIVAAILGGARTSEGVPVAQFLIAPFAVFGVAAVAVAGYVNLAESVANARAQGVLRRLRGTPLPAGFLIAGRAISALVVGLLSTVVLVTVAVTALDVRMDAARLPALLLAVVLGVACFAALGLAVVPLLRSARSVLAITLGTLLPLSFVSEVFVVGPAPMPAWLVSVGNVFPLRHLLELMLAATRPGADGSGVAWTHLAIAAAWTVGAALVVVAVDFSVRWAAAVAVRPSAQPVGVQRGPQVLFDPGRREHDAPPGQLGPEIVQCPQTDQAGRGVHDRTERRHRELRRQWPGPSGPSCGYRSRVGDA